MGALARLFGWGLAVNPFPRHWLHGKPRFPRLRHDPCHEMFPVDCYVIQEAARQTEWLEYKSGFILADRLEIGCKVRNTHAEYRC